MPEDQNTGQLTGEQFDETVKEAEQFVDADKVEERVDDKSSLGGYMHSARSATEGSGKNEGFFEVSFIPHITTQKFQSYQHNGKDVINYEDLKYAHN